MSVHAAAWNVPPFKAGQSVHLDITWSGDEGPIDLIGAWCACTFRRSYRDDPIFTLSSTGGGVVLGQEGGNILIMIPPEATAMLNDTDRQQRGVFDVKVILGSGLVDFPIADGRWYCDPTSTVETPDEGGGSP